MRDSIKNKKLIEKMEKIVTKIAEAKNLKDIPAKELKEVSSKIDLGVANLDSAVNSIFLNLERKIWEKEREIEKRNVWIENLEKKIKNMEILERKFSEKEREIEKRNVWIENLEKKIKNMGKDSADLKNKCKQYENESRAKEEELGKIYKSISYRFGKKMSKNVVGKVVKKILSGEK